MRIEVVGWKGVGFEGLGEGWFVGVYPYKLLGIPVRSVSGMYGWARAKAHVRGGLGEKLSDGVVGSVPLDKTAHAFLDGDLGFPSQDLFGVLDVSVGGRDITWLEWEIVLCCAHSDQYVTPAFFPVEGVTFWG